MEQQPVPLRSTHFPLTEPRSGGSGAEDPATRAVSSAGPVEVAVPLSLGVMQHMKALVPSSPDQLGGPFVSATDGFRVVAQRDKALIVEFYERPEGIE